MICSAKKQADVRPGRQAKAAHSLKHNGRKEKGGGDYLHRQKGRKASSARKRSEYDAPDRDEENRKKAWMVPGAMAKNDTSVVRRNGIGGRQSGRTRKQPFRKTPPSASAEDVTVKR